MSSPSPKPPFRKRLIASGLVTLPELEQSLNRLREQLAQTGIFEPTDEQIAADLVKEKLLSQYQANQLLAGHTKLTLGAYAVVDPLGQGGMGQVFLARHQMLGRFVAVKVLPLNKTTPESIASFMREIRAQAQLDHENLVRAIDAGQDGNVYYLVCEYVPGMDLRRLVRERGVLSMIDAANVITQAARGLDYAHQCGLVHRDVKPGNLLVTPENHCKVSDLGLAGWLHDQDDPRAGKIVGTSDYLSPEQILTPLKVTSQSDIYSLGCTLYYATTGKVPFPGGSTRDKAKRHCEDSPIHPRVFNRNLSERFVNVLTAMMAKDTEKRLKSMHEVIERLAPWVGGDATVNEQTGAWRAYPNVIESESDNVLDGNQDTEPGEVVVDTSFSSPRISPPTGTAGAWTIPDDPNQSFGSGSQSIANFELDKGLSNSNANNYVSMKMPWLIAVLLGVIAALTIALIVALVTNLIYLNR